METPDLPDVLFLHTHTHTRLYTVRILRIDQSRKSNKDTHASPDEVFLFVTQLIIPADRKTHTDVTLYLFKAITYTL